MKCKLLNIYVILFGLPVFIISCAHYQPDKWTKQDTYRHITLTTVLAIDYLQTREVVDNDNYIEQNPILGNDPSQQQVAIYASSAWLATTLTAYMLPAKWRKWLQIGVIGVETACVINNHAMGIRISF